MLRNTYPSLLVQLICIKQGNHCTNVTQWTCICNIGTIIVLEEIKNWLVWQKLKNRNLSSGALGHTKQYCHFARLVKISPTTGDSRKNKEALKTRTWTQQQQQQQWPIKPVCILHQQHYLSIKSWSEIQKFTQSNDKMQQVTPDEELKWQGLVH